MNVTLLRYAPDALDLLVATKQTRLSFKPATFQDVKEWPEEKKLAELAYMLGTIESSWEFCDYVFLITDVSRAFTHQLVRSRHASYAQQSQRTVDMSGFEYIASGTLAGGPDVHESANYHDGEMETVAQTIYHDAMGDLDVAYQKLIAQGIPPQDARGLLPTNVTTAIVMKVDLREMSHMAALRLCTRTQGEYQQVFKAMREAVIAVHGWAEPFLRVHCARHGVCAFPNYTECPIKGPIFNPDTGARWDGATQTGYVPSVDNPKYEISGPALPATRADIQENWVQLQRRGGFEAKPREMKSVVCDVCDNQQSGYVDTPCTLSDEHGVCTGYLRELT